MIILTQIIIKNNFFVLFILFKNTYFQKNSAINYEKLIAQRYEMKSIL